MLLKKTIRKIINRTLKIKIKIFKILKLSKTNNLSLNELHTLNTTENSLEIIIFSKDRPIQLHALLESLQHFSNPKILPHVIYNAKNPNYQEAYNTLFQHYPHLFKSKINDENLGFKTTLIELIEKQKSDKITFFVDDIIFKNHINWDQVITFDSSKVIPSLRLAPHLNFCYTMNDYQLCPSFKHSSDGHYWFWNEGDYDWNYPLSVDGNIFSRTEFLSLIKDLNFKAPNTLESKLQKFNHLFTNRLGFCFSESVIVNNPVNKVQSEVKNLHGKVHQDELLELWNKGLRIDFLHYQSLKNQSCHQDLKIEFKQQVGIK